MLTNLFWGLILKDCIEFQEKKRTSLSCVHVVLKTWTYTSFSRRSLAVTVKKRPKKVGCTCKVVFCQSKPISIAFLPLSLSLLSPSPLLKLPIVYKRLCFVKKKQCYNYFLWKKVVVLFSSFTGKDNSLLLFCLAHVLCKTREIRHLITSLLLQRPKNLDVLAKLLFC